MARLTDVFRGGDASFRIVKPRRVPIYIDESITMIMQMDGEFLPSDENQLASTVPQPTKTEMNHFMKKFKLLSSDELAKALRVTWEDYNSILTQMVACVGCRRSVETLYQSVAEIENSPAFYPMYLDKDGTMRLLKERMDPKFLCQLFCCVSPKVQDVVESLTKSKSRKRCILHSLESQRIRTVSSWVDVWDYMDKDCQEKIVQVDSHSLTETLDRYLKKHRFCAECKSKVLRAYHILIQEVDPASEPGYIPHLYEGLSYKKSDGHIHILCKTDYVSRLIAKAVPELVGSSRRERHAKTMEIAQEEVLTCIGLCVFERLHRLQQRFREEERTWEIVMCIGTIAFRRSFELAIEQKLGISQLELLCEEIKQEEKVKHKKKEMKKMKRKRKKARKAEEEQKSNCDEGDGEDKEEDEGNEKGDDDENESKVEEASRSSKEGDDNDKTKNLKDGDQAESNKSGVPAKQSSRESKVVGNQGSSRCSSENSRDCGYSSEAINENGSCSSPDYFDGHESGKYHEQDHVYKNSETVNSTDQNGVCQTEAMPPSPPKLMTLRSRPNSFPIPYRSLEEQLESSCSSDDEELFIPEEEVMRFLNPSGERQRQKLRESLVAQFDEMIRNNRFQRGYQDPFASVCKICNCPMSSSDNNQTVRSGNNGYNSHVSSHFCKNHKPLEKENNQHNGNGTNGTGHRGKEAERDKGLPTTQTQDQMAANARARANKAKGKHGSLPNRRYKGKNRRC